MVCSSISSRAKFSFGALLTLLSVSRKTIMAGLRELASTMSRNVPLNARLLRAFCRS